MKNFLFFLFSVLILTSNGQQLTQKCGHDYVIQQLDSTFGDYSELRNTFMESVAQYKATSGTAEATVFTIPVVVHIIYDDDESNISRAQVLDAIRLLNLDYRRMNADTVNTRGIFKSRAADIEVEFALAKLDPNGNCTNGITRTFSNLTNGAGNNVKSLINWNNKKYLNIWVVASINSPSGQPDVLGYAYQPFPGGNNFITDGIVIRHDQMGNVGTALKPTLGGVQLGRTLTHESGHYLGLDHTFEGGCFGLGDNCADTPPVFEANYGCNLTANSCTNDVPDLPDMTENYLDYSDGDCMNMFTIDQKNIMRFSLSSATYRNQLVTSATATSTGIAANQVLPCAPTSDFASDKNIICEGESVQFIDQTYFGNPTSYTWTFAGGNPSTSSQKNPIVTYAQKGNYDVELTTTNAAGSNTYSYRGYVSVRSQNNTPYINTFGDNFELYPIPNENWHVNPGIDTSSFRYFSKTAYAGQSCVTLQNFYGLTGETDEMISHAIDVSNSTAIDLRYNYSFVERASGNSDKLRIYISDDCGQSWTQVANRQGPLLRTLTTKIDTAWWPTQASHWKQGVQNLSQFALNTNYILIKFEFQHGGGNNFYLDEVQINTTIGTEDLFSTDKIRIYPNPAQELVTVELPATEFAQANLLDITGRIIAKQQTASGIATFNLASLEKGIYIIQVNQDGELSNHKVLVK